MFTIFSFSFFFFNFFYLLSWALVLLLSVSFVHIPVFFFLRRDFYFLINLGDCICRVTVFEPSPLQWICREWGQKLGCDEMTACFGDERHTKLSSPIVPGRRDPSLEDGDAPTPSRSRRSLPPLFRAPSLGGLCCYLFLSSVHPPPTLVSHSCLSSSARPLSHSFWRFVSYCGPHRPV